MTLMHSAFNYRSIVISVLIYDLIATDATPFAATRDTRTSTSNSTEPNKSSGRTSVLAADNCCAINENVDNFDEPNRNIAIATVHRRRAPQRTDVSDIDADDSSSPPGSAVSTVALWAATTTAVSLSSSIAELNETAGAAAKSCSTSSAAVATANCSRSTGSNSSITTTSASDASSSQRILSRSKRFLAFPEGSSFSVAVCFTVGIIGNPRFNYMSYGLNWGVAYDLPNTSWVLNNLHGFSRHPVPAAVLRRRTRRSLYGEIENALENMGYNGRDCVLRALCESRQYFQKNKMTMIGEMVRAIFSLPKQRLFTRELREYDDITEYDRAYRRARSLDCAAQYDCAFSLLELAFGKYSTPPAGYYGK